MNGAPPEPGREISCDYRDELLIQHGSRRWRIPASIVVDDLIFGKRQAPKANDLASISLPGSAVIMLGDDVALSIVADAAERQDDRVNFFDRGKLVGSFKDPRAFWLCDDPLDDLGFRKTDDVGRDLPGGIPIRAGEPIYRPDIVTGDRIGGIPIIPIDRDLPSCDRCGRPATHCVADVIERDEISTGMVRSEPVRHRAGCDDHPVTSQIIKGEPIIDRHE